MRKNFPIISWISIAALYCFFLSTYSNAAIPEFDHFSESKDAKAVVHGPDIQANLDGYVSPTGSASTLLQHASTGSVKHTFNPVFTYSVIAERVLFHFFTQYSFYAEHVLVRLRQTDLIFPFHYFL